MIEQSFTSDLFWLYILIILFLFFSAFGVVYAVLQAAVKPPPTMLVVALSVLTLSTTIGFVITRESDLITLTGVGLGALAGAVNSVFNVKTKDYDDEEEKKTKEEK